MKNEYALLGKKQIIVIFVVVITFVIAGVSGYLVFGYHVDKVSVVGNEHYSDKEIKAMVLKGGLKDNSLLLALEYRNKSMKDIPFVETMDIEIIDNHSIKINVYEKALAGCVDYLGRYMYFDREGIVVESSEDATKGVPEVTGLDFNEVLLFEPLPVDDPDVFALILSITQLLKKYEIVADKIHFEKNGKVELYCDKVRVNLGKADYLDEKIMQLPNILPHLEGKKGVLQMEEYNGNTQTVTFELSQ